MGIGFREAGCEIIWACDFDKFAVQTYRHNVGNHVIQADIKQLTASDIPQADIWAFGFPCQDLSTAGQQRGFEFVCDDCGMQYNLNDATQENGSFICPNCRSAKAQLTKDGITGKLIHLCFTCDPYPHGYNTSATRAIIMLLKETGNHVQILTKNTGSRDFDILDDHDWYGVTIDGTAPLDNDWVARRITDLKAAHEKGIKTWVSFEPVVCAERVLDAIRIVAPFTDKVKIGKLNYCYSDIDWKAFGEEAECLCKNLGLDYYIKDSLRKLMNGGTDNG